MVKTGKYLQDRLLSLTFKIQNRTSHEIPTVIWQGKEEVCKCVICMNAWKAFLFIGSEACFRNTGRGRGRLLYILVMAESL